MVILTHGNANIRTWGSIELNTISWGYPNIAAEILNPGIGGHLSKLFPKTRIQGKRSLICKVPRAIPVGI